MPLSNDPELRAKQLANLRPLTAPLRSVAHSTMLLAPLPLRNSDNRSSVNPREQNRRRGPIACRCWLSRGRSPNDNLERGARSYADRIRCLDNLISGMVNRTKPPCFWVVRVGNGVSY